jgi:hypothetical protein
LVIVVLSPFFNSNLSNFDLHRFLLVSLAKSLSILFMFSEDQLFISLILCSALSLHFNLCSDLYYFFPFIAFGFGLFFFF